jgi:hypothetical protein
MVQAYVAQDWDGTDAVRPVAPTATGDGAETLATGATTVTRQVAVTGVPAAFTTVKVYKVVTAGETVIAFPLVTMPTPLSMVPTPLVKVGVKVVVVPSEMEADPATKVAIAGAGAIVSVTLPVALPEALVTTHWRVNVVPVPAEK